jgi:AcrR family transcriptional regulator
MLTRREKLREATRKEIKMLARGQMREKGSAGLSLRGIAAEMGFTVTALYRYYSSLDDLITALIADAFDAHADAMEQAAARASGSDYRQPLLAALYAYRGWALENTADFELIYGNPIPGYEAPREVTVPKAVRTWYIIGQWLQCAVAAGQVTLADSLLHESDLLRHSLEAIPDVSPVMLHAVVTIRIPIHGFVMLEIHGHLSGTISDPDAYYQRLCVTTLSGIGLTSTTHST